jgi:uncharacterized repeat protein (TIGR03803 family)
MTPQGGVSVVYSFDGPHGTGPVSPVIEGGGDRLYGTAYKGGVYDLGVTFELSLRGINVLHSFGDPNDPTDGALPRAGLTQATDGNFYGVTYSGGILEFAGVIFQFTPAGAYSILYDFEKVSGISPQTTLMQHTNGKLYGTTEEGGSLGYGAVYCFDLGLPPFVKLVSPSGRIGQTGGILGQGFTGTTSVSINGIPAAFTVVSDTYLTATVPPGATTGFVTVVTPSGTLTSNQKFRVRP